MLLSGFFVFSSVIAEDLVYISQIQITGGSGKTTNDFVEIFNPGADPFNLNGFRLVKRTAQGSSDTSLYVWENDVYVPPQSFYLWAHGDFIDLFLNTSTIPDATSSLSSLASGNGVALRFGEENTGSLVESVAWGTANNGFFVATTSEPTAEKALVRKDLFAPTSTYDILPGAPRNSTISYQIPDETPSSTPESEATTTPDTTASSTPESNASSTPEQLAKSFLVKILRFLPNPAGTDSGSEWVELINEDEQEVLLDGWFLDDESTDGMPGSSAFKILGTIIPGETKRFVLPEGSFALNNSGGDEVNLYFGDKSLAHKTSYRAAAYDDGIFEFRDGQWQPPAQNTGGSSGGSGSASYIYYAPAAPVKLSEIFANPAGDDTEKEWVEIYNEGNSTTSLEGYFLADGISEDWSKSAWAIPEDATITPKGFLVIYLPKNSLTLNNSGQETVKLFSSAKQLLDKVSYKDASENQSYSKNEKGEWNFGFPTPGRENIEGLPEYNLLLSEILPDPLGNDEEFVEIKNNATNTINTAGLILQIGSRSQIFEEGEIAPGDYAVFYEDDLPVRLSNNGQTIILKDIFGRELFKVEYPKAKSGESYALTENGEYAWTEIPSPKEGNVFVLGTVEASVAGQASSGPKTTTAAATKTSSQNQRSGTSLEADIQVNEKIQDLEARILELSQKLALLGQIAPAQADEFGQNSNQAVKNNKINPLFYLLLAVLALALFVILIRWFFAGKKSISTTS